MLTDDDLKLIGGSDVAALVGLNRRKSPIDIYRRIVEGYRQPDNKNMMRGRMLEPSVLSWYAEENGVTLRPGRTIRNWWKRATLDAETTRDGIDRVVEVKTCNIQTAQRYGDGPDDVPEEHLAQVTWYMGEAGLPMADLAALLAGAELRVYSIRFDEGFYDVLCEAAARFYQDHILPKRPPPLDGLPGADAWINERFPKHASTLLAATPAADEWAIRMKAARDLRESAEQEEELCKQHLKALIGDAEGMAGDSWRVSWKNVKGQSKTDWEAAAKDAGVPEDIIRKYTSIRPGARVFRPTFKEQK